MQIRRMRKLRKKHKISIYQLAKLSCVSRQRLTQIELEDKRATENMQNIVESAFCRVIEERRRELSELEADCQRYRGRLLEYVNEEDIP